MNYANQLKGEKTTPPPLTPSNTTNNIVAESRILESAMALKARWDQKNGGVATRDDMQMVVNATSGIWAIATALEGLSTRYPGARRTAQQWFNFLTGLDFRLSELELDLATLKPAYSPRPFKPGVHTGV